MTKRYFIKLYWRNIKDLKKMYRIIKCFFDRFIAIIGLIITSPFLLILLFLLVLQNQGNPLFKQVRLGKEAKLFTIYKFKTMRDTRNAAGELLPDIERITPLGNIIRKLSLDELPQIWNVIRGEMSFVGPRPLLLEYLSLYSEEQNKRHLARPGITGWAQVNGRNTLSWKEKFELDLFYVNNQSFRLDIKIIMITILKVIKSEDVNSNESITMEPFNGKN